MTDLQKRIVKAVLEAERRWTLAHLDLDLAVIASLLSERYRHYEPDGSVSGKTELLASYGSGERHWEIAESTDHRVDVLGETAVLTGHWRGVGVNAGERFDYAARFVCLYVLEEGEWRLYLDFSMPLEDEGG
jgi:hypothetical protein